MKGCNRLTIPKPHTDKKQFEDDFEILENIGKKVKEIAGWNRQLRIKFEDSMKMMSDMQIQLETQQHTI